MIKLLIAEDSKTVQRTLVSLLETEKDIFIVGIANNGEEALQMCHEHEPDLVTMDIFMPGMNGLDATRRIMAECPTRIVIISSMVGGRDLSLSFDAMRAGAVEIIEKPGGVLTGNYSEVKNSLIELIRKTLASKPARLMSWLPSSPPPSDEHPTTPLTKPPAAIGDMFISDAELKTFTPSMICIGGSTGAPAVIVEIISRLPKSYPLPIVVAQHISKGFAAGMATWLDSACDLAVRLGKEGDRPKPGEVLIGPDDHHMIFNSHGKLMFIEPDSRNDYIPSVNHLFSSAASVFQKEGVGILLSGMGKDGAAGLNELFQKGALTICQNESSSVVYGMPRVAAELGAARAILPPPNIAEALLKIGAQAHL